MNHNNNSQSLRTTDSALNPNETKSNFSRLKCYRFLGQVWCQWLHGWPICRVAKTVGWRRVIETHQIVGYLVHREPWGSEFTKHFGATAVHPGGMHLKSQVETTIFVTH